MRTRLSGGVAGESGYRSPYADMQFVRGVNVSQVLTYGSNVYPKSSASTSGSAKSSHLHTEHPRAPPHPGWCRAVFRCSAASFRLSLLVILDGLELGYLLGQRFSNGVFDPSLAQI